MPVSEAALKAFLLRAGQGAGAALVPTLEPARFPGHSAPCMELSVRIERWPLAGAFTISRGSKTEAVVVVAELSDGTHRGRGEFVPYARYGETPDGIVAAIEAMRPALRRGLDRAALQGAMPAGAARNALDCAYWDVNAKATGRRVYELAGLVAPVPRITAYTISLASPTAMAAAAERAALAALAQGEARQRRRRRRTDCGGAPCRAAGRARSSTPTKAGPADNLQQNLAACADAGVTLIEQPLPEGRDEALARIKRPIPVCADESVHDRASLDGTCRQVRRLNIKLDKAGGLPRRLALAAEAERHGFAVMVGCMVATSFGMAPAMLPLDARWVDWDDATPARQGSPRRFVV